MTHTPHELAADFPEHAERIHHLKVTDGDFRVKMEAYHDLNRRVHRAETLVEPVSQDVETELRKRRAALKDALYRRLSEPV